MQSFDEKIYRQIESIAKRELAYQDKFKDVWRDIFHDLLYRPKENLRLVNRIRDSNKEIEVLNAQLKNSEDPKIKHEIQPKIDHLENRLRKYIKRSLIRQSVSFLNKTKREANDENDPNDLLENFSDSHCFFNPESIIITLDILKRLKPKDRDFLAITELAGKNNQERGHLLGIKPNSASMKGTRLKQKLESMLLN